jgi:hypothetical protein
MRYADRVTDGHETQTSTDPGPSSVVCNPADGITTAPAPTITRPFSARHSHDRVMRAFTGDLLGRLNAQRSYRPARSPAAVEPALPTADWNAERLSWRSKGVEGELSSQSFVRLNVQRSASRGRSV